VEDVEICNALLVGGTKFTQNNAHLFCEQVSCYFQMAFMIPQRREVLSITQENSTDLGIKQKMTENGVKPHTQKLTTFQHSVLLTAILRNLDAVLLPSDFAWVLAAKVSAILLSNPQ